EGVHFVVADLGSTNGTFVNDRRIRSPVALNAGDEVRFGSIKLAFSIASASTNATPRPRSRAGILAMLAIIFIASMVGTIYHNEIIEMARSLAPNASPTPIAPSSEPANLSETETAPAQPEPTA